jgi:hypothetical protein
LAALGIGGCAAVNGYLVDQNIQPGKFQYLRCNDIAERLESNENRRIELSALMERAASGTGGAVVNIVVYRPELDQVDAEINMLHRAAGEKRCAAEVTAPTVPQITPLH